MNLIVKNNPVKNPIRWNTDEEIAARNAAIRDEKAAQARAEGMGEEEIQKKFYGGEILLAQSER